MGFRQGSWLEHAQNMLQRFSGFLRYGPYGNEEEHHALCPLLPLLARALNSPVESNAPLETTWKTMTMTTSHSQ